jgi:ribosomal-protein-alanine N-acetyltransferase
MGSEATFEIVAATPGAAAECAALHAAAFATPWDRASFERLLAHPAHIGLLARAGAPRASIGFILGQMAGGEGEILTFAVAPAHRRTGIGRALLEALCTHLARSGARRLHCEVASSNAPALRLYRRLGFAKSGRRRDYYVGRAGALEDALLLTHELGEGARASVEVV